MILSDVVNRLSNFGYTATDNDTLAISFLISKVKNHILNECNISEIPKELHEMAVDAVCGEFLFEKKRIGQLKEFDFEAAVKTIQEGDTSITFADGTSAEQNFDSFIMELKTIPEDMFAAFRCLKW